MVTCSSLCANNGVCESTAVLCDPHPRGYLVHLVAEKIDVNMQAHIAGASLYLLG